jgi:feruloyl esterase
LGAVVLALHCVAGWAAEPPGQPGVEPNTAPRDVASEEQCTRLVHQDFSKVMDAPTQVISSRPVAAKPDFPAYCEVRAYVWPQVQFYLWLPLKNWSGRLVSIGCGGSCGVIEKVDASKIWQPILRRGDVAMFTDMGHTGRDTTDLLWAVDNPQGQIDFGFRATHVSTVAGKALARALYGRAPTRSYFVGNSTGGRQGLIEAQRFPTDYQGIVSKCPAVSSAASDAIIWALQALSDRTGRSLLNVDNTKTLSQAVLKKCDRLDGVADSVISEPQRCDFDPETVSCARSPGPGCLTPEQVTAVKRAYLGPPPPAGSAADRRGLPLGSESIWIDRYVSRDGTPTSMWDFMMNWLRADQPVWDEMRNESGTVSLADYDVARFRTVRGTYQLLQEATDPDLSEFAAQGGKLIMMQGMSDVIIQPSQTTRYYQTAVRTAGGLAATQKFFRYFMMPGVGHCFSGDGTGADVFDGLVDITRWVEDGQPPEKIVALKLLKYNGLFPDLQLPAAPDNIVFSRPLYPFPARAVYRGSGDPREASSFKSVTDDGKRIPETSP